jgi:hypothetical protein
MLACEEFTATVGVAFTSTKTESTEEHPKLPPVSVYVVGELGVTVIVEAVDPPGIQV